MTGDGPMDEDEADSPVDPEVRAFLIEALAGAERPGQRERVLAAIEAEGQRLRAEAAAKSAPRAMVRPRKVWPVVVAAIVTIAAVAVLLLRERGRATRMVTPGTEWTPGTAAPVPPHRGP